MAYVGEVMAPRLGRLLPWILGEDPRSAYHLGPVVEVPGVAPPRRRVMGTLRLVQGGGDPARLRAVVTHGLEQLTS